MTPEIEQIDLKQLNELIKRIEHAIEHGLALNVEDMKLLLCAITTLCSLQQNIENKNVTLHKLRKLLGIVTQSESRRKKTNCEGKDEGDGDNASGAQKNKAKTGSKKKKRAKPKVEHVKYSLELSSGQICPECQIGKLYKFEVAKLLRITGHAPYAATQHIMQQLRCNACLKVFTAPLSDEVLKDGEPNQMYGYSARALMVVHKFYSGIPYNHQGNLADIMGYAISASTIFDQCEKVSNMIMPIFCELKRLAANAEQFLIDDTHNRILEQKPEHRERRNGKGTVLRTGIYSSGLIAILENKLDIILFETSLGHSGEHLDDILRRRDPSLLSPLIMSDALSSNSPTVLPVRHGYCNAHCRRLFYDLKSQSPTEIEWLLDTYGIIWKNDNEASDKNLNAQARLAFHKEKSLPVMEELQSWATEKSKASNFEANSPMGKAIKYLLRHFDKLSLFCHEPGALLDNNRMEEKLKIVIRGRKTSHFYKTAIGAGIANVLISIIATTISAGINIFHYLCALQQHHPVVKAEPSLWLPWNYEEQLKSTTESKDEVQNC
jgi:transposase